MLKKMGGTLPSLTPQGFIFRPDFPDRQVAVFAGLTN
jgi:hypothetical protein